MPACVETMLVGEARSKPRSASIAYTELHIVYQFLSSNPKSPVLPPSRGLDYRVPMAATSGVHVDPSLLSRHSHGKQSKDR